MRVLLQRVSQGSVTVAGKVTGSVGHGLVLLVGIAGGDTQAIVEKMAAKTANLRIFNDDDGKFNRSLLDVGGGALVISQFTLYADARRGRRPAFTDAARPELASGLVDHFAQALRDLGVGSVEMGVFGANMSVGLTNEGPVTIWLDSDELIK